MQSYPLDLATMLYNLQSQRGRLSATLECVPGLREPRQAILDLVEGKVTACTLMTSQVALVAEGVRALDFLERLGTIGWLWKPVLAPPFPLMGQLPQKPHPGYSSVVGPLSLEALLACSHLQRWPLSLVDSRCIVADVATLLAVPITSLERLQATLSELEQVGVIQLTLTRGGIPIQMVPELVQKPQSPLVPRIVQLGISRFNPRKVSLYMVFVSGPTGPFLLLIRLNRGDPGSSPANGPFMVETLEA